MNKELKTILSLYGVSGYENSVKEYLYKELSKLNNYQIIKDNLGGIGVIKNNNNNTKTVCFASHMDEVGFIVTKIHDNGILELTTIGGLNKDSIIASEVSLISSNNVVYPGVICSIAPHIKDVSNDVILLDIGLRSSKELKDLNINLGNMVTFNANYKELNNDLVLSKAVDDRLGCYAVLNLARQFNDIDVNANLIFYFTVQEEVGTRGAEVLGNMFDIDYFIAIDCSPLLDYLPNYRNTPSIGNGFLVRMYDPSNILNYNFMNKIIKLSNAKHIKYQYYISQGGTDAAKVLISKSGVLATTFGIGSRYIHSTAAIFSKKDLDSVLKISKQFILNLDKFSDIF